MELRTFISQTLIDLVGAVQDAQARTPEGTVVPHGIANDLRTVDSGVSEVQGVQFEVTVKADERKGSEAKLSVVAAVVGGSVAGSSGTTGGHAATLRFRVPVKLPTSRAGKQ
jgi:hypothetical protein